MKLLVLVGLNLCFILSCAHLTTDAPNAFHDMLHFFYGPFTEAQSLDQAKLTEIVAEILGKAKCEDHPDEFTCESCSNLVINNLQSISTLEEWNAFSLIILSATINVTDFCGKATTDGIDFEQYIVNTLGGATEIGEEEIETLMGLVAEATEEEHHEEEGEGEEHHEEATTEGLHEEGDQETDHEGEAEEGEEEDHHAGACFGEGTLLYYLGLDHDDVSPISELPTVAGQIIAFLAQDMVFSEACEVLPKSTDLIVDLFATLGNSSIITEEGFETLLNSMDIGTLANPEAETSDSGDGHGHKRKRRSAQTARQRSKREVEASPSQTCLTEGDFVSLYGLDLESGISTEQFYTLCPSIVQQKIGGYCQVEATTATNAVIGPGIAEIYGYGTLAVVIISLTSMAGAALIPCLHNVVIKYALHGLIALGVGTMFSDSLLHLIPKALGLHDHSSEEADEHLEDELAVDETTLLNLVISFAIYGFFLFETLMSFIRKPNRPAHGHSHEIEVHPAPENENRETKNNKWVEGDQSSNSDLTENGEKKKVSIANVALLILIGDSIHNLLDGIAIGAAFTLSLTDGFGTSVAIFCHELPHELGDFSILINSGMSVGKALLLNILSACACLIGLYIGAALSSVPEAQKWVLSVTAGMFLYIALVDMMPELLSEKKKGKKWIYFLVAHVGMIFGILIMLLIAIYEERIIHESLK